MKIKNGFVFFLLITIAFNAAAQEEEKSEKAGGFKKENLFTGGTLNLSFGNQVTALGLSPFFGYSINRFVDVAASVGVNYISQRDYSYYNSNDKLRQTIFGPGAFVRVFPVKFLFAQAQYEYNFIRYKYILPGAPTEILNLKASSFLIGPGYAGGRERDNNSYYYISVLWDIANSKNSPYKDNLNRAVPIIRAGYNIALFQGRYGRD
jgi:hypothetical protein